MERWVNVHETHCYRAKEQEFNDWYDQVHLPDVIDTPDYIRATRYEIKEFKKGRGAYLTLYEVETDDIDKTIRTRMKKLQEETAAGRGSDLWVGVWPFVFFRRILRKTNPVNAHHSGKPKWVCLVETDPVPGKEREYNIWYDRYIDDILEEPGFVAASRYVIKEPLEGRGSHLAIYEIETDDIDKTLRISPGRKDAFGQGEGLYTLVWGNTLFRQISHYPRK
jgi:hypothetical protein